jgi:hypothetical protein
VVQSPFLLLNSPSKTTISLNKSSFLLVNSAFLFVESHRAGEERPLVTKAKAGIGTSKLNGTSKKISHVSPWKHGPKLCAYETGWWF